MNPIFIDILRWTHIVAGSVALVVAPVAMVVQKGGKTHRLFGKVFFWCMTWVFVTAVVMAFYHWIPFLLMIAFFSFYTVFAGYRTLYMKQLHRGQGVRWYDWISVIITGVVNILFIGYGILHLSANDIGMFSYLAIGFGIGGLMQAIGQLRSFLSPPNADHWLYNHIGNMIGGFIAATTAFSATVLAFIPGVMQWIWPTLVGLPFIVYWQRTYRKKIASGKRISELVELKR